MRYLWTTSSVALFCAVLTVLAYPHPPWDLQAPSTWPEDNTHQQVFLPPHHRSKNNNGNTNEYARFDDEQVIRMEISSLPQLKRLEVLVKDHNLDLWSNLRIGTVDVRVPVSKKRVFATETNDIPSTVMIDNLQSLVSQQASASDGLYRSQNDDWDFTNSTFWLKYHDFATLNNFTETMVQKFPDLVKRVSIGYTYEGKEIFGMSIHGFKPRKERRGVSYKDNKDDDDYSEDYLLQEEEEEGDDQPWWSQILNIPRWKPSKPKKHPEAIIIAAGQHAREWIGPAVVTYIAKELILGYGRNRRITQVVDRFEFVIVPVLNADGYVYTWETNRMWRKNRQPTTIPLCPGIDLNRNWGYLWTPGGSFANPCSEGYQGPEAFAALESKMMADFILERKKVVAYIDFHAYSQLWMIPFGGDCSSVPRDEEDIMEGALGATKALRAVHGKKYTVGSICNVIYQASGGSIDWTYAKGQVKYSYGVELRDTGRYGFLLPETEIIPSGEETFAAVMSLASFIRKREKQWGYMI